jgi:hypothetical protein
MKESVGFECFGLDVIEAGDFVVPFEESSGAAGGLDSSGLEIPDGIGHRMIVCGQCDYSRRTELSFSRGQKALL